MKAIPKPVSKSFKATLERMASNLGWVIIRIPFDVLKIWGTRGQLRVKGEINGFAFRTSLFPSGNGYHYLLVPFQLVRANPCENAFPVFRVRSLDRHLAQIVGTALVNKRMQAGAKAAPGDVARFRLKPDTEERKAIEPAELKRYLAEDRSLRRWFGQLNYSTRREIGDWIMQVKSLEARARRAAQIAERLLATMEAERELPPVLKAAFARDPRALAGWQRMSPSHRRGHLFGIFYYRSPEARDRRVTKTIEDAIAFAERKTKKEK